MTEEERAVYIHTQPPKASSIASMVLFYTNHSSLVCTGITAVKIRYDISSTNIFFQMWKIKILLENKIIMSYEIPDTYLLPLPQHFQPCVWDKMLIIPIQNVWKFLWTFSL